MRILLLIIIVLLLLPILTLGQKNENVVLDNQGNQEGRQQLINAVRDLENATLDSIDYSTHQTADSYALLATAADLTPWWGEAARLSLDVINSVVGLAMAPEEFLNPDGAKKALKNPSTFKQIIRGIKDSKKTLGAISAVDAFRGIFRDAESYKLSFMAISKTEEMARQEYEVSGDNTRTANAAWLELWTPSTANGLPIPLKTDAVSGERGHKSTIWVNGLKAARDEIKKSFDSFVLQVPDPLPADYPLNETLTYLENLTHELRLVDNRVVSFSVIKNGEIKKRPVTLGMAQVDRETTDELYDAWNNKQDVQYESTLYNTGETICSITMYTISDPKNAFKLPKKSKKILNGGSETLEYIDVIRFFKESPSELAEEITKPVDPLDALQGHSIATTNDLVSETSNLWTISNETLLYLQYTWESIESTEVGVMEAATSKASSQVTAESWNKTFGGAGSDWANSVQQTSDGGYILAGYTESYGAGGSDAWLIKTDSEGRETWNRTFGGANQYCYEEINSVQQTSDGGYILAGTTESFGATYRNAWLIKTDSDGNEIWSMTFGKVGNLEDEANSVQQTSDGGYILAGVARTYSALMSDAWLMKTDCDGREIWNKTFGVPLYGDEIHSIQDARSVQQTSDGGYILAGQAFHHFDEEGKSDIDAWLIKTDANGDV